MISVDVCIVGGGPAGSTVGRSLAARGHDILLVEQCSFPRQHIGESLPPTIVPVLRTCGVAERIEAAGFLRPDAARVRWRDGSSVLERMSGGRGFQVDRARFDALLFDAAREAGCRVMQPARAGRPRKTSDGWIVPVATHDTDVDVLARFLVDAAGRHAPLERTRHRTAPSTVAIYGYWQDLPPTGPETIVEAGDDCWYWGAPLPDGSFNAVVFVDAKRCAGSSKTGIHALYRSLLVRSSLLSPCVAGSLKDPVKTCDATGYADTSPVDAASIKVGEASFAIDPLSSQGVQSAMRSALQAGIVVHTLLKRPESADAAMEFYRRRQAETVDQHRLWAGELYAEQSVGRADTFWNNRAHHGGSRPVEPQRNNSPLLSTLQLRLSPAARIVSVPTVDGDFVVAGKALDHPALVRPVAYLDGIEIASLLTSLRPGASAHETLTKWSRSLEPRRCWEILSWLWSRRVLVPAGFRYGRAGDRTLRSRPIASV